MSRHNLTLVWFRQDLRIADNPMLRAAMARGAVVPVYIWSPREEGGWPPGFASRWWLERSLRALDGELRKLGSRLILREGNALETLRGLVAETGADAVYWSRRYEPATRLRDARVNAALSADGLKVREFSASTLFEPHEIRDDERALPSLFDAFWAKCLERDFAPSPVPAPTRLAGPTAWPASLPLTGTVDPPAVPRDFSVPADWTPGVAGARALLVETLERAASPYSADRSAPRGSGLARLSPHLHFGEIGPREFARALIAAASAAPGTTRAAAAEKSLRVLGWREFAYHYLYRFPFAADPSLTGDETTPSRAPARAFDAWRLGRTGFPLVDAAMRELRATGWLEPRLRLVAASFAAKRLGIGWLDGARWFRERLVDADLAEITLMWRWVSGEAAGVRPAVAGAGALAECRRIDPRGRYVRRWIPEIAGLANHHIHRPWEAPADKLAEAGVRLGIDYPAPVSQGPALDAPGVEAPWA